MMNKQYDDSDARFWDKTSPRVVGDIIGRPEAVELCDDIVGKRVLEAGCGTGYVARMLQQIGAEVFGCDISQPMISKAQTANEELGQNIVYSVQDICQTNYSAGIFDLVTCVGVLIHLTQDVIEAFLVEAHRLLKGDGSLVISVTHPCLYLPFSPSRTEEVNWVKHTPIDNLLYDHSQRFQELYCDCDGNCFESIVWHHPEEWYMKAFSKQGFVLEKVQCPVLQKNHLQYEHWGSVSNYPVFWQVKLTKKEV